MTEAEFDAFLRQSLEDQRFSRSEKQALAQHLADLEADNATLARFRHLVFERARRMVDEPKWRELLDWVESVIKALQPKQSPPSPTIHDACFIPEDDGPCRIVGLLDRTRRCAEICVFTITDDRIANAILRASDRGIGVRIITDNDKSADEGSDIERLRAAGIDIRMDRTGNHMHHKFAIFDEEILLTGSYNWTRSAARHNKENFIVTNDANLVGAFRREFDKLWQEFAP
ncbi:MAG: hypothetical protein KatS3mg105_2417 [Gemmatales bacterium]|nr:MAG: hypothetical protein KatS3mg105_2417 [Gemmatales bacterium]